MSVEFLIGSNFILTNFKSTYALGSCCKYLINNIEDDFQQYKRVRNNHLI